MCFPLTYYLKKNMLQELNYQKLFEREVQELLKKT